MNRFGLLQDGTLFYKMNKKLLLLMIAGLSLLSCAPKETTWSDQFESMLPLLGHRNWIVVAEAQEKADQIIAEAQERAAVLED